MNFSTLHHIAIIASNYEEAKEFYINKLNFRPIREVYQKERGSRKLDLRSGDLEIELFIMPNPPARVTGPEACGLRHIAFETEDLDAAVHWLEDSGISVEPIRIDPYTGSRFTFFFDPDGLPLELKEK